MEESMANVGVVIPSPLPVGMALPEITRLARDAERAGLDCIWAEDHLAHRDDAVLDLMCLLAAAAAATEKIEIGSAVFVPSLRNLSWALKQVATVQLVAGGRLQLGVALGAADEEEYGLAGLTRFGQRQRTDEFLHVLAAARRGELEKVAAPLSSHAPYCSARRSPCHRYGSAGPPWLPFGVRPVSGTAGYRAFRLRPSSGFLEPFAPTGGRGRPPLPIGGNSAFRRGRQWPFL